MIPFAEPDRTPHPPRKSPCGHGRVPKNQRGNRDQRLRGRIITRLRNWGRERR